MAAPLTVLQALALAGGTNRTGKHGECGIIRKGPTGMTETRVPLEEDAGRTTPDINLQADDILFDAAPAERGWRRGLGLTRQ